MTPLGGVVIRSTWRSFFGPGHGVGAILGALLPGAAALLFVVSGARDDAARLSFAATLFGEIVIGTLLPLAAVVLGTSAFGSEVDEGTLIYLLIKPMPRSRVVFSKFSAVVLATLALSVPGILLSWLILGSWSVTAHLVLGALAGVAVATTLYAALFLELGLASRRGLALGLVYVVMLELTLSRHVAGLRPFSVRELALSVATRATRGHPAAFAGKVSINTAWIVGAIILVVAMGFTMRRLARYEIAERL